MNRLLTLSTLFLFTLGLVACNHDSNEAVLQELKTINAKLDKMKAPRRGQRPPMKKPVPKTVYSVGVDGSPSHGSSNAKVTIVEAYEFACPFCYRVNDTISKLLKQYGKDLRVVYRNYVVHPSTATIPAMAACAAQRQGKFLPMDKLIWEKGFKKGRDLSEKNMIKLAGELKLNMKQFNKDLKGDSCKKQLEKDQKELSAVGVRGTPAFFINGRFLSGAQPIDRFKALIDEELKKANAAIAKGMSASNYYRDMVIKKGKKTL